MTTEIAVINRLGVALAADSAVTISGFGSEKVFDSGDKLFELSYDHSVAIMVNGNLDFLGVPWELIIKDFRKENPNPLPSSIPEWSDAFLQFVLKHRAVNAQQAYTWLAEFVREEVQSIQGASIDAFLDGRRNYDEDITPESALLTEINSRMERVDDLDDLKSLGRISAEEIEEIHRDIEEMTSISFPDNSVGAIHRPPLNNLLVKMLISDISQDTRTGLVICGFGGDDLFPSLHAVTIDGVLSGRLRYEETHNVEITRDVDAVEGKTRELGTAISFAQTDVIERLLRGVDQRFVDKTKEFLDEALSASLTSMFDTLDWKISDSNGRNVDVKELANFLSEALPALYEKTAVRGIGDEIEREFKQTISLMPKQELLELAEALVSITAVERKASRDAGTVGGPIDVALITRSEGFVWIKRKHHFKAELNPRYLSRVQRLATVGDAG